MMERMNALAAKCREKVRQAEHQQRQAAHQQRQQRQQRQQQPARDAVTHLESASHLETRENHAPINAAGAEESSEASSNAGDAALIVDEVEDEEADNLTPEESGKFRALMTLLNEFDASDRDFFILEIEERLVLPALDGKEPSSTPPVALFPEVAKAVAKTVEFTHESPETYAGVLSSSHRLKTSQDRESGSDLWALIMATQTLEAAKKQAPIEPTGSMSHSQRRAEARTQKFSETAVQDLRKQGVSVAAFQPGLKITGDQLAQAPEWRRRERFWGVTISTLRRERHRQREMARWIEELRRDYVRKPRRLLRENVKTFEGVLGRRRKRLAAALPYNLYRYGEKESKTTRDVSSFVDVQHIQQLLLAREAFGLAVVHTYGLSCFVLFLNVEYCAPGQPDSREVGTQAEKEIGLQSERVSYTLSYAKVSPVVYRILLLSLYEDPDEGAVATSVETSVGEGEAASVSSAPGTRPWFISEGLWRLRGAPKTRIPVESAGICARGMCVLDGLEEVIPFFLHDKLEKGGVTVKDCPVSVVTASSPDVSKTFTAIEVHPDAAWMVNQDKMQNAFVTAAIAHPDYYAQLKGGANSEEFHENFGAILRQATDYGQNTLTPHVTQAARRSEIEATRSLLAIVRGGRKR